MDKGKARRSMFTGIVGMRSTDLFTSAAYTLVFYMLFRLFCQILRNGNEVFIPVFKGIPDLGEQYCRKSKDIFHKHLRSSNSVKLPHPQPS